MPWFYVQATELWSQWYLVEADNEPDAIVCVSSGLGAPHPDGPSYVDTLDEGQEQWLVLPSDGPDSAFPDK